MATKKEMTEDEIKGYINDYNESDFWNKIKKYGKSAGVKVVYSALKLYYVAASRETPVGIKALIYGALGYFIFPVDLVPDIIPVVGFADDLAVLTTALLSAGACAKKPEIKQKAKDKLEDWFDDVSDSDLDDVSDSDIED